MVYLNRIYTRTGDGGETSLGDGTRIAKTHPRIAAHGDVDELNSVLGLVLVLDVPASLTAKLRQIQNNLFDLGADLCLPLTANVGYPPLRMSPSQVTQLETWIDEATETLQPLTSFILPGGTAVAAQLHHARTVCRRAELSVLRLADQEDLNPAVTAYLNRLSDLLFVLARIANDNGRADVLWKPGKSANADDPASQ